MRSTFAISFGAGIICFGLGILVGKRMATNELMEKYTETLNEELEKTKIFYASTQKPAGYETPLDARNTILESKANDALKSYQGEGPTEEFEIISQEQYSIDENDFDQVYATYYRGDDRLADAEDTELSDVLEGLGEYIDLKTITDDSIFLRCGRFEYEIYFSDGRYDVEVLGLDPEGSE
jgi:hypothetical protein